ncbi:hypothetical protein PTNB85_02681 [Pyrenophora teres f. teres]|nr:hypothetical protein PTNB85_02681 [Pyrenophora teres f. teres]
MVLDACTTTIAILQSVSFYNRNKELLQKHQILLKLFTFKSVLGLNFFQSFVISMLAGHGKLRPNKYMTFHDINTGLASLILACEMPTFAILMIVAFSPQPYKYQGGPAASPLNAIFDACNISDLLSALFRGPMRLVREQQRQILRQNSMRIELVSSYDNEERMGDKGAKVQMITVRTSSTHPSTIASLDNKSGLPAPVSAIVASVSTRGHLSVELWAHVLHHLDDDYTLWVTCRQVSRDIRAEAEREFAKARLPHLNLIWTFDSDVTRRLYGRYGDKTDELQCFIDDGMRAQFRLFTENERPRTGYTFKQVMEDLTETPDSGELGYLTNILSESVVMQTATLGHYANDIYIPGLIFDFEERTLAFEWKAFLDNFYKDTTYVNAQKQTKTPVRDRAKESLESLHDRIEKQNKIFANFLDPLKFAGKDPFYDVSWESWLDGFDIEDDYLMTAARVERLRCAYSRAGLTLDLNKIAENYTEAEFKRWFDILAAHRRKRRNRKMLANYCKKNDCKKHKVVKIFGDYGAEYMFR